MTASAADDAPDLRISLPRRSTTAVDGIVWLPRMIDKARAFDAGTLGPYLYGQSPVDDALLHAAGVTYEELLDIVRRSPTDEAVVSGIETQAPGAIERMRAFSLRPPPIYSVMVPLLEVDEGYIPGSWGAFARRITLLTLKPVPSLLRRLRPMRSLTPRVR